jgi:NADPH:quinone reductase-like Zn-dependent oxidoreductase
MQAVMYERLGDESVLSLCEARLPVASGTALQALADIAQLRQGQAILITGASGAVGASAVQLARSIEARITGVCGMANVDYVRSIGADRLLDYKTDEWLDSDARFDVIFDAAASNVIVPRIGEVVSLGQVAAAQCRKQEGKAHGKVCVRVDC